MIPYDPHSVVPTLLRHYFQEVFTGSDLIVSMDQLHLTGDQVTHRFRIQHSLTGEHHEFLIHEHLFSTLGEGCDQANGIIPISLITDSDLSGYFSLQHTILEQKIKTYRQVDEALHNKWIRPPVYIMSPDSNR